MAKNNDDKQPVIIIKKIKKGGGGHHGGAWKVAYADFVTAMMAFFLLLWLLNVTTKEQKMLISSYFSPTDPRVSESVSGSGGVMGGTTISPDGAMTSSTAAAAVNQDNQGDGVGLAEDEAQLDKQDENAFKETEKQIKQAIEENPELKELSQNLIIDMTPEGLRIQIVDQEGKPMFALGSAVPLPHTEKLLRVIASIAKKLPNKVSVRGHTDSKPYGKDAAYSNWELSADRANASRRVMTDGELEIARIENVQGKADREHLVPDDPNNARNRRISIILLKQSLVKRLRAAEEKMGKPGLGGTKPAKPEPRKQEDGVIYFP